jgi:hypothetical protein
MQCSNPPCPSLIVAEREKQCRSTPATVRRTHDLGSVAQSSATQSRSVLTPDGVVRRIEAGMLHDSVSLKPPRDKKGETRRAKIDRASHLITAPTLGNKQLLIISTRRGSRAFPEVEAAEGRV